jgi:hypothetical protein
MADRDIAVSLPAPSASIGDRCGADRPENQGIPSGMSFAANRRTMKLQGLVMAVLLAGCGSDGLVQGNTTPGDSVLTANVTQVTYTSLGGGLGPGPRPPAGAACDPGQWSYVISFAAQTRASTTCTVNGSSDDPASFVPNAEEITLDDGQWQAVKAAIAAVTVSDRTVCGADLWRRHLVVDSPAGSVTYGDDFYACQPDYPYFVTTESLNNLSAVLAAIP